MNLSEAFAADLLTLFTADTTAEAGAARLLEVLSADARAAVDSFVGVSFILMVGGRPITFTAFDDDAGEAGVATSAVLPLAALCAVEPGSMLIIYASRPGALVDFSADAAVALGLLPGSVLLDRHIPLASAAPDASGLAELILINQAIGILLGQGLQPVAAMTELQRLAWMAGAAVADSAAALIAAAELGAPPPRGG